MVSARDRRASCQKRGKQKNYFRSDIHPKMAGLIEIDSFVHKYKQLLSNGFKASLYLEADQGDVHVTFKASLGLLSIQEKLLNGYGSHSPRKRNLSYLRRQERRRKLRQNNNARAEKAPSATDSENSVNDVLKSGNICANAEEVFETKAVEANHCVINFGDKEDKQSVLDELKTEEVQYEVNIDVQEKVKNFDVIEAVEVNFDGGLNDLNIEPEDPSRYILVHKLNEVAYETEDKMKWKSCTYKILVKNVDAALNVIESWKKAHNFDDLAFRSAERDEKQVKIRDIRKIH